MMTGKEKLHFLLDAIDDARAIAPSGRPITLHSANDLNNRFTQIELTQLLDKLQLDEKVLRVVKIPNEVLGDEFLDPYAGVDEGCYYIEILPTFDTYFMKIKQEPEYQGLTGEKPSKQKSQPTLNLSVLHPEIFRKCRSLFEKAEYPEAVEKGFKVVKDRLRDLTGYETGSDAFGKAKLHIKGAVAQNVNSDFNEGVKFLTMAIDRFRNEKSHTSNAKIDDPQRAYEYLSLSSLAMRLLDQAEIVT